MTTLNIRAFRPERLFKPRDFIKPELSNPQFLEIGAGKGMHAMQFAEANPGKHLIAIERTKNKSDVFTINASGKSVVLKNMTVRHGDYGIYSTAGNVTVDNCKVYRNGYDGQAIGTHVNSLSSMQTFRNSHMHSSQTGGGIYIQSAAFVNCCA